MSQAARKCRCWPQMSAARKVAARKRFARKLVARKVVARTDFPEGLSTLRLAYLEHIGGSLFGLEFVASDPAQRQPHIHLRRRIHINPRIQGTC
uniref:DUF4158 domain-containing protein n=1 Tax=Bursaphelenchus xylophilus TaxID=6326 RepID=A0A1I7RUK0_BURXY